VKLHTHTHTYIWLLVYTVWFDSTEFLNLCFDNFAEDSVLAI
jgi:hypothetical protein